MRRLSWAVPVLILAAFSRAEAVPAAPAKPTLTAVTGLKWPNHPSEGLTPVATEVMALDSEFSGQAFAPSGHSYDELLPYVMASPDQEDAGSCLYMSLTGIAELWLARLHPALSRAADGPLDLSERYLMNVAGRDEGSDHQIANWKTDSVLLFNPKHQSVLNSAYRFTRGWYTEDSSEALVPATRGTPRAVYDSSYNWIDQRHTIASGFVALPQFKRDVLFADPASDQWNVAVAPSDIVARVKAALVEHQAPVHVVYNHFGYWHAVVIVGYNDDLPNGACSFVTRTKTYLAAQPDQLRQEAAATSDAATKARLLATAARREAEAAKLNHAYEQEGGCHGDHGVFYVRDSIYPADSEPLYNYDPAEPGQVGHYSKKVIVHEYDWLLYLANHLVQISVEPELAPDLHT